MIFFTSDIHFSDERIMKLCGRPYKTFQQMDEHIISKWNNKVKDSDTVYIIGDLTDKKHFNPEIINQLNGNIFIVFGNHDYPIQNEIISKTKIQCNWNPLYQNELKIKGVSIIMFHFPIMDWDEISKGNILLYGHVHNKNIKQVDDYYKDKLGFNVSMDVNDLEPVSLEELIEKNHKRELYEYYHGNINSNHISIEGMDGVGKSSTCKMLANKIQFEFVEKPLHYLFDKENVFDNYLKITNSVNSNKNRDFTSLFYGLGSIYMYDMFKDKKIITDRHLASNFAWSGVEHNTDIYDLLVRKIGKPKLTVILYSPKQTIIDRLKKRDIEDKDIKRVKHSEMIYSKMVDFCKKYNFPYLLIDTSELNIEQVVDLIIRELKID